LKKIRSLMGTSEFAQAVFDKVFYEDIERLRSMSEMWQSRNPPESLEFDTLKAETDLVKQGQALSAHDQRIWSTEENLAVFCYSLDTLSSRAQAGEQDISFDKDDKDTLDFVSAAANLRSYIFGIPQNSEWEIKQMAGNIIPAIATSNALTASLSVMLSYKVLKSQAGRTESMAKPTANNSLPSVTLSNKDDTPLGGSRMVFLNSRSTERTITSQPLGQPNPRCPVCSPVYGRVRIPKDAVPTLQDLVDEVQALLKYEDFQVGTSIGVVYEPDLDDNLPRPLTELGVDLNSNSFITITDDSDEPRVDLILSTSPHIEEQGKLKLDVANPDLPYKPKPELAANDLKNGDIKINDVMPSAASVPTGQATQIANGSAHNSHSEATQAALDDAASGSKRKRDLAEGMQLAQKRAKPDTVDLDASPDVQANIGDSNGAILLDDD
jgi:ubiquitin-like 1-activating enzyme E1 B